MKNPFRFSFWPAAFSLSDHERVTLEIRKNKNIIERCFEALQTAQRYDEEQGKKDYEMHLHVLFYLLEMNDDDPLCEKVKKVIQRHWEESGEKYYLDTVVDEIGEALVGYDELPDDDEESED